MGAMHNALARLTSLRPLQTSHAYTEVPDHDLTPGGTQAAASTIVGSPLSLPTKVADVWSKPSPRRRLGCFMRTSPKRLAIIAFGVLFTLLLVASGTRHYIAEHDVPPPPADPGYHWLQYPSLSGFYNGVRSLVKYTDWVPEQESDPEVKLNVTKQPPLDPVAANPYPDYNSVDYLKKHRPVRECFIDAEETIPAPDVYAYPGLPGKMPSPLWGSYENLNMKPDQCWERFGRFGPYGYSYSPSEGGLGLANSSEHSGADKVEEMFQKIDYRNVNWGDAQKRCFEKNRARFVDLDNSSEGHKRGPIREPVPRQAYVLRTWTGYEYSNAQLLSMRAMVNELSLKSGGEYDVHLLVHVKDNTIPIWADEEIYNKTLQDNVPKEFWDIATLWSEAQMRVYYPGPFPDEENLYNHAKADVYGVYRSAHFSLQWFAQQHPEYEFFWNWEMDVRYSGHYYEFHQGVHKWAAAQPRKLLWERSAKFWIPGIHGSYKSFTQFVAQESMADDSTEPIWGPVKFETGDRGMLEPPASNKPPRSFEEDEFQWGVGEDADLLTFDPIFDPVDTFWVFRDDVNGYDLSLPAPPRRAALVTLGRLSRRLLHTMHEETYKMRHTMFPEMWPATVALHHGYKAAFVPHPVYFDRIWPLETMDQIFNYPKSPQESPFGWGEHNFQGSTFYYNAGFSTAVWHRWFGAEENGSGGKADEERNSGRMCVRGMLHHPIKEEKIG